MRISPFVAIAGTEAETARPVRSPVAIAFASILDMFVRSIERAHGARAVALP
jgi:hypothetical protein